MKGKREFSTVREDYLRAVYSCEEWDDDGVGVTELAQLMDVVPSTASENVRKLRDAGLLDHRPYQKVRLTPRGRQEAIEMVRRHRILETFLHRFLGFSWDELHDEAHNLEHAVSDRFIDRLDEALEFPRFDPHGDPIPDHEGEVARCSCYTLPTAPMGETMKIMRIRDGKPEVLRYFENRNFVPGALLTVLERSDVTGQITVQMGDERIDISQDLGAGIKVTPAPTK
ncbi:MAG: metal-dependent transcriptional regulator [Actinomycetaceae bacterium]|nr:metal-dependent transcriptional regulator [Actinomycetaceae bacterium]